MRIPESKAAVDEDWDTLENLLASDFTMAEVVRQWKTLMDLCHLKHAELTKYLQMCKERVVLGRDTVKDDNGYKAVFTEQGASASQVAAATLQDAVSRSPSMTGEANDTVSAYTQVDMSEAPR